MKTLFLCSALWISCLLYANNGHETSTRHFTNNVGHAAIWNGGINLRVEPRVDSTFTPSQSTPNKVVPNSSSLRNGQYSNNIHSGNSAKL